MRSVIAGLLMLLAAPAVWSQDAPPTEASIRQLFEVMHTSRLLDSMMTQIDQVMHSSIQQSLKGQKLNAEQQQILDDMGSELAGMVKQYLKWSDLEPQMIAIYRKTFSQQEIDGMLAFYRSPTGQAVIEKLPLAMQNTMQFTMQRVGDLQPKIAQLQRDTIAALKRAQSRSAEQGQSEPPPPAAPASPSAPPTAPH
ncbi:MAG TPA: DUF2059 domain-containing protein [Steroidobacteraceae bacterium]|nr:DUF2059 domain-containing protein [Steroidobacteraceae bacterium]